MNMEIRYFHLEPEWFWYNYKLIFLKLKVI